MNNNLIKSKIHKSRVLYLILITCMACFLQKSFAGKISESQKKAETFLINSLIQDKFTTTCQSSSKMKPCPLNNTGTPLTLYYITTALSFNSKLPEKILILGVQQLLSTSKNFSWGYAEHAPIDADDTAYAINTLLMLGLKPNIQLVDGIMLFHNSKDNLFSTFYYNPDSKPAEGLELEKNKKYHIEVNANVYYLLKKLNLNEKINLDYIVNQQSKDGSWTGGFQEKNLLATYMSLRLLCEQGHYKEQTKKGTDYLITTQNKNGSWGHVGNPYDTALALNSLMACKSKNKSIISKGVLYLLSMQSKNGSWVYQKPIWKFLLSNKPIVHWYGIDSNNVVTTSLALMVLNTYQNNYNKSNDTKINTPHNGQ